jgi:nitrite reductase/ring-hydroxylating ferredoxin subunit
MFVRVAALEDIAEGGVIAQTVNGRAICLCRYNGSVYAVERACGHKKAGLEKGTLEGYILTCPLHFAQFDITTGQALSGPVPPDGAETAALITYTVKIESGAIFIDTFPQIVV